MGTGALDAILFGKPTLPASHVRRTKICCLRKSTSCHCNPRHSETLRPVAAAKRVNVRSGSGRAISKSKACLGVRIKASYSLVVLQRTKRSGFDSSLRGIPQLLSQVSSPLSPIPVPAARSKTSPHRGASRCGWPPARTQASEKMEYSPCQTIPKLIPAVPKRTVSSSPNPVTGVSTPPKPGFSSE